MKPFEYQSPACIGEAVTILADAGRKTRPLAGGTDLLVQWRRGQLEPDVLVDVKRIPELNRIALDPVEGPALIWQAEPVEAPVEGPALSLVEGLTIGAAVSCARLCEHPDVRRLVPGLVDAASLIGGPAIQARATLGGNLCNAAPSADSIPALIVLGATCTIAGPRGARTLPASAFCTGPGETALGQDELLVSIHFPAPPPHSGARYLRFTPRREMDIAVAGAGVWIALSDDHARITGARIALAAVAPTPLLVETAGRALIGQSPTEEAFAEAAKLAQEAARPISDVRGTAAQRRHLVGVLVRRALEEAVSRAKGEWADGR